MRLHFLGHVLAPEDLGLRHVIVEDGRVTAIEARERAPDGALGSADALIVPGLVDIQLNGAVGEDFSDPGADLARAAAALPATGVTAFLATIVSSPPEIYVPAIRNLAGPTPAGSAHSLGIHVEGPFIADARRGTHDPAVLRAPDRTETAAWIDAGPVRIVTLAPELPGALDLVAELTAHGVIVSIGHSDATWGEADAAIAAGARLGTHLFNAMRPLHHREPGIAGRLLSDGVAVSLVVDGVHLAPETVRLVASIKDPEELVFITDAMAALGMPPGRYPLATREVTSDGIAARLPDGTLSGSAAPMAPSLGRLVAAGLDPVVAVRAASTTPAALLGAGDRLGRIEVGRVADLVVMDAAWNPMLTLVQGDIGHGEAPEPARASGAGGMRSGLRP